MHTLLLEPNCGRILELFDRAVRGNRESYRGFLKIHVAVDAETGSVLVAEVTGGQSADCRQLKALVSGAAAACGNGSISTVLADGAYDSRENFSFLEKMGMEAAIPVRRNSVPEANGDCPARMRAVYRQHPGAHDRWRHSVSYGRRWTVESVFSVLKRCSARRYGLGTKGTWPLSCS